MPTTVERGLGAAHQRLRREFLPAAYGTPCPLCGEAMSKGQPLELDHIVPRMLGGEAVRGNVRIVHAYCNRVRGGRLGHRRPRRVRVQVRQPRW